MTSRAVYRRQGGRKFFAALAVLSLLTAALVSSGSAVGFTQTNFELDKNATHTLASSHLGALKSSVTSSATSIVVCELAVAPTTPFTIQIDAERMTVTAVSSSASGTGGCAFANPADVPLDSRTYTVTRGVSSTAAAHVGSAPRNDVTLINSTSGHDWDQVYADYSANPVPSACNGTDLAAIACIWKNRPNTGTASSANGFTGPTTFTGTSGDLELISQWTWTNQSVPDADEINDALAIKYQATTGQQLFVAMDRYAVNGSKDIGFWFFKDNVGPVDGGSFSGVHTVGDILLLSTFSGGGGTTTIRAYEWVGSGGSDGALNFLGSFGDCVPGSLNDSGCATTANTTVPAPWPHQEKPTGASANVFYSGGFMEGGLDLKALGLEGCFSSFMGTSRSSPSLTAQPKAFVFGHFENCTSGLTTQPADSGGTALTDHNTNGVPDVSIGTGSVNVTDNATLTVSGTSTFTGSIAFFICGPLSASALCGSGGVSAGSVQANGNGNYTSSAVTLTSAGRYCWRGVFTTTTPGVPSPATDSTTGECFEVLPVTPSLVTQAVDAAHVALSGPVDFGNAVYDEASLGATVSTASQPGTNGGSDPGQADNTFPSINATNGAAAGGTIAFTLTGPDTVGPPLVCSTTTAAQLTGTTGSNPESVNVSGNNNYFTSGFTPAAPGQYHWVAVYAPATGDPNNIGSTHNATCSNTSENVTVRQIPTTISTAQKTYPQDSATITSSVTGDNLPSNGTVTFYLYGSAGGNTALQSCQAHGTTLGSGGLVYSETKTSVGGSHSVTVNTANTTFAVTSATNGTYYWRVTYATGDSAHTGIQSDCAENVALTFTDDSGPGTAFP